MQRAPILAIAAVILSLPLAARAATPTIVPWASRGAVDSDGDGVADLVDNAPGTPNVSQIDSDTDQIGDAIDPTPFASVPNLGDPGLGLYGPYTIPVSTHVFLDYQMLSTPPGAWGHIDLDLGADGTFDATWFGPLTTSINTIDISPALFADANWNLNQIGSYELWAKAFGPGMPSQNVSITDVNVVAPEPTTLGLLALGVLATRRRR